MEHFYGFDLGDAESAVSVLDKHDSTPPRMLSVGGNDSFITAYAVNYKGQLILGEKACYEDRVTRRAIRFKSRFLWDTASHDDVKAFAAGVIGDLRSSGNLTKEDVSCFYVGCPAGWSADTRELYREIFECLGYPPVRIVPESRAALVSACQSKHLQIGYNILAKPVLVVDIGSSTTDFAYIVNGREMEMQVGGDTAFGGGLLDEMLLEESIKESPDAEDIRRLFAASLPWKNYCEFAARRLKERYFEDKSYWKDHPCRETLRIYGDRPLTLMISMDQQREEALLHKANELLGGKSFQQMFQDNLAEVRGTVNDILPELIFLTGGVSRMQEIRRWCREIFPESVVISAAQPEFSVARGLAWCGSIDEELREFRQDLEQLKHSRSVEQIISGHIEDLYRRILDAVLEPVLMQAVEPVFEQWRNREILRLEDVDHELEVRIQAYLKSAQAREILSRCIAAWLRPITGELEELTMPICARHHVPYSALSLNTYYGANDLDIHLEARDLFAVREITLLIDSIITIIVGLLCGGSGVALISAGPGGLLAGAALSLVILLLGKNPMEQALLHIDLPKLTRKLIPRGTIKRRMKTISATVKERFFQALSEDKDAEITDRLVDEISVQIEECLTKMAEVVEIPLG